MRVFKLLTASFREKRLPFVLVFYGAHIALFVLECRLQVVSFTALIVLAAIRPETLRPRHPRLVSLCLVLAYDTNLLLLPVLRNTLTLLRPTLVRLCPADEIIWFHRQVAYSMAFWTVVHATSHCVNFFNIELSQARTETALDVHYTQAGGISGHSMLLFMLLIYTTAHHKIRHQCFEAFWYTHHLAFFFFLALYSHATGCFVRDPVNPDHVSSFPFYSSQHCFGYESWRFTVWPGIAYFAERMYREYRARKTTSLSKVLVHSCGTIELRITKPSFEYIAGQWLFIQVPGTSASQWHPFNITSAPEDPYVSIHTRQVGDWTYALGERLGYGPSVVTAMTTTAMKGLEKDETQPSIPWELR